jgi:hypothetical protein
MQQIIIRTMMIYNFFYLISLGYAAPYPCHPLASSMDTAVITSENALLCVMGSWARGCASSSHEVMKATGEGKGMEGQQRHMAQALLHMRRH